MARTKGKPTAPKKESFVRTIEYNDAHVGKTASGKIFAVFNLDEQDETRTLADSVSEAKSIIDSSKSKSRVTDDPRPRGRRTKGVKVVKFDPEKYKHLSHGGYRMCPPAECPHKIHWEGEPAQLFWADNIICASVCRIGEKCENFKEFLKGSKKRIKLQSTERMAKECEWCKSTIAEVDEDGSGVFHCGTTYNRLEGEYTRVCKPPKKEKKPEDMPKPKKRRTKK